jgi:hypothetical protein
MHFYPKLYDLPGGMQPNWQLRRCLGNFIGEYPASMRYTMAFLQASMAEHEHLFRGGPYEGDLEADFLRSLGEIQRSAREMPVRVEIDFRR